MQKEEQFYADVLQPWMELNGILVQQIAIQPDVSSVLSKAHGIAVSIKHQVDALAAEIGEHPNELQETLNGESTFVHLISDVANQYKHKTLKKKQNESAFSIQAVFEANDAGHFRFLRNSITVTHGTLGPFDFMVASSAAISFWIKRRDIQIPLQLAVEESSGPFVPALRLAFKGGYSLVTKSTNITILKRDSAGTLQPFDPKNEMLFEVIDPGR